MAKREVLAMAAAHVVQPRCDQHDGKTEPRVGVEQLMEFEAKHVNLARSLFSRRTCERIVAPHECDDSPLKRLRSRCKVKLFRVCVRLPIEFRRAAGLLEEGETHFPIRGDAGEHGRWFDWLV